MAENDMENKSSKSVSSKQSDDEKREKPKYREKLYNVILSLKTEKDCEDFFSDLCTPKELDQMSQRLSAARLLIAGKTYNEVIAETEISSATLSRVSRALREGSGYVRFLKGGSKED